MITPLVSSNLPCPVSFGHCGVCHYMIYGSWLPLWYLQTCLVLFLLAIAVSVITWFMVYDYPFGIFKLALSCFFRPLQCLSLHDLWFMIIPLISSNLPCPVSFGHWSVCHYTIYGLWLSLWYLQTCLVLFLLAIAVSVITWFMVYDYPFDIFKLALSCFVWPLECLSLHDLWFMIIPLVSSNLPCPVSFDHCRVCHYTFMVYDYPFGIFKLALSCFFWPLRCLSLHDLWFMIIPLISSNFPCPVSFGHWSVCQYTIYGLWLSLWYLQTCLVLFLLTIAVSVITRFMVYDYPFGIFKLALSCFFWPLRFLSLHDLWFMIIPLISSNLPFPVSFGHCGVCHYMIYGLWLSLWYLQTCLVLFRLAIGVSGITRFMVYDYPFGIFKLALSCFFWPLRCLSLHDLWFMIIPLVSSNMPCPVSFDHCGVCNYTIYGLWLSLWYLQTCLVLFLLTIAVSGITWFMVYDYPFGIFKLALSCFFWPLRCLSLHDLWFMIIPLVSSNLPCPVSFDHCGVCHYMIYGLWLSLWYLQTCLVLFLLTIAVSIITRFIVYDYPFGIFKLF